MKLAVPDLVSSSYFSAVAAVELGYFAREGLDVPPARHRHRLGIGGHSGLPSSESRRVRGGLHKFERKFEAGQHCVHDHMGRRTHRSGRPRAATIATALIPIRLLQIAPLPWRRIKAGQVRLWSDWTLVVEPRGEMRMGSQSSMLSRIVLVSKHSSRPQPLASRHRSGTRARLRGGTCDSSEASARASRRRIARRRAQAARPCCSCVAGGHEAGCWPWPCDASGDADPLAVCGKT